MNFSKRVYIGGAPIDPMDAEEAVTLCLKRLKIGLRTTVTPVNAAIVVKASYDRDFQNKLKSFDIALADGFWAALAATCLYREPVPHAGTPLFVKKLLSASSPDSLRIFLLGARPEIVKRAAKNLHNLHPNAMVVGYKDGYFCPQDEKGIVDFINKTEAQILFLGISSPNKEFFLHRNWADLTVTLCIGVGGLFDVWAEEVKDTPTWIARAGFGWLFRLCQEPKRLWKRYTITNLQFISLVIRQAFGMVFSKRQ